MDKNKKIGLVTEIIGILVTGSAVCLEIVMKADIYLIIATFGAFTISTGGLIWAKILKK